MRIEEVDLFIERLDKCLEQFKKDIAKKSCQGYVILQDLFTKRLDKCLEQFKKGIAKKSF